MNILHVLLKDFPSIGDGGIIPVGFEEDNSSGNNYSVKQISSRGTSNQKYYPDLGSNASSVWNFCARFSDVISRWN